MRKGFSLCVAVLAAGQSRRFGPSDKLAQRLNGTLLGVHICDPVQSLGAAHSLVIAPPDSHACTGEWQERGFTVHINPDAGHGMGTSVAMAARLADAYGSDALLICLADMPFVTAAHLTLLMDQFEASRGHQIIASYNGTAASPPAIFGRSRFVQLAALEGNAGARALLDDARLVSGAPDMLMDIDTPEDFKAAAQKN